MPVINGIYTKDFPAIGRSLLDSDIIVVAVSDDDVTYKTTLSALRSAFSVSNNTVAELDTASLNIAYPNAGLGFEVICESITDNPLIYKKGSSGWYSIPLGTIA